MSTLEVKELSHPAGQVIKIASGKTLDLKSQGTTTLPTGSVLQVISATNTNTANGGFLLQTTSTSFVSVPLAVSITPSSTSSKIMILVTTATYRAASGYVTVYRNSTNIGGATNGLANPTGSSSSRHEPLSFSYLDSPNTTSSVQYTLYVRTQSGTMYVGGDGDLINSITVMEVSA